jgi:hypothetical protein
METDETLGTLREFIATARELEATIPKMLPPRPSESLVRRSERLKDAIARARRQAGHMAADLLLADAECWKEITIRRADLFKRNR